MKPNTNTEAAKTVQTTKIPAVAPAATCSRDWWVVDRNNGDAKINGPHGSAETAGSVRHVLELNASEEQNERWNLCVVRIPENDKITHGPEASDNQKP